jgi:hypothetical protein
MTVPSRSSSRARGEWRATRAQKSTVFKAQPQERVRPERQRIGPADARSSGARVDEEASPRDHADHLCRPRRSRGTPVRRPRGGRDRATRETSSHERPATSVGKRKNGENHATGKNRAIRGSPGAVGRLTLSNTPVYLCQLAPGPVGGSFRLRTPGPRNHGPGCPK